MIISMMPFPVQNGSGVARYVTGFTAWLRMLAQNLCRVVSPHKESVYEGADC
jgi:hypothetical protein